MRLTDISTFRAFRNRNYALFFTGQSISRVGMWMQRTAVIWLVYIMTHSTFMIGVTMCAEQFPAFLFSLFGGIVSDRYNRYKIILITQTASMIQAILLTLLILFVHYTVWEILALSVVLGTINAFDMPARQPLVHQMINDKADLPNALSLNSSLANLARLLGPALSGIILERFGAGNCFLLNALSFAAVLTCLLLMKLPPAEFSPERKKIRSELIESFVYLKKTPEIGMVLLMLALVSFFVLSFNTLLPVFAKDTFKGNAATYGYISSFIGLGAIVGTFFLASLRSEANLKKILWLTTIILGVGLMLFSHTLYFALAMIIAVIMGFGRMSQVTISNILVQTEADIEMRGRVMSFLGMALFGMVPLGSLFIGAISERIGAPDTLLFQGVITLIIVAAFSGFLRKKIKTES